MLGGGEGEGKGSGGEGGGGGRGEGGGGERGGEGKGGGGEGGESCTVESIERRERQISVSEVWDDEFEAMLASTPTWVGGDKEFFQNMIIIDRLIE